MRTRNKMCRDGRAEIREGGGGRRRHIEKCVSEWVRERLVWLARPNSLAREGGLLFFCCVLCMRVCVRPLLLDDERRYWDWGGGSSVPTVEWCTQMHQETHLLCSKLTLPSFVENKFVSQISFCSVQILRSDWTWMSLLCETQIGFAQTRKM